MENINGIDIGKLPIKGLEKVEDLIEFEGPILTHFKDAFNNNYLYYWVDFNNEVNRWLVWKISEAQLYNYLKGTLSLRDILEEKNKDYIYSCEIDADLNYRKVEAIYLEAIPEKYKLEEDSFYVLDAPLKYESLIEKFEENLYLVHLRELALYFKLESIKELFSNTISTEEASDFLKKITNSFLAFVEDNFISEFQTNYRDLKELEKVVSNVKKVLSPRIVQLAYNSFNVGISADYLQIQDTRYKNWQKNILSKYKEEVVDIDYNSDNDILEITNKYDENARKKIFGPYLDIINDGSYRLSVTNQKKSFKKSYTKVNEQKKLQILPNKILDSSETDKKKLFNVVMELNENQDFKKISNKSIQTGLLFSQPINEVELPLEEIKGKRQLLKLVVPFTFKLSIPSDLHVGENLDFEIRESANTKEELLEKVQETFIENYQKILSGTFPHNDNIKNNYLNIVVSQASTNE